MWEWATLHPYLFVLIILSLSYTAFCLIQSILDAFSNKSKITALKAMVNDLQTINSNNKKDI